MFAIHDFECIHFIFICRRFYFPSIRPGGQLKCPPESYEFGWTTLRCFHLSWANNRNNLALAAGDSDAPANQFDSIHHSIVTRLCEPTPTSSSS